MSRNKPIVFAHRGFSGLYPENTLLAFRKALEAGATGIELDVQLSKDGEVFVIHDEKFDRTTDSHGLLIEHTSTEIKRLSAGSWFDEQFSKEEVPLLKEVLELIKDSQVILNIELKTGIIDYVDLEEKVLELTHLYQIHHQTVYSSFNHYSLQKLKQLDSTAKIGLLYMSGIFEAWKYAKRVGADALHPLFYAVRPDFVASSHNEGLEVNTYTVNDKETMKLMIQTGVDGIITDYPDQLCDYLNKK